MDRWLKEFIVLVVLSMILSGVAYYLQFAIFFDFRFGEWNISSVIIRSIRMILIYVVPVLLFQRRHGRNWTDLGLLPSRKYPILSVIGGIAIYFIAVYVFLKYKIFFNGWAEPPWSIVWIKLFFIGIMASITDFWTRGFVLLELSKKYDDKTAIFWQNLIWFVLHLYEIEALNSYIGYFGAIVLTLVLGIGGDMIALKTRSITGLMIGHIILNVFIALAARDSLFFFSYI